MVSLERGRPSGEREREGERQHWGWGGGGVRPKWSHNDQGNWVLRQLIIMTYYTQFTDPQSDLEGRGVRRDPIRDQGSRVEQANRPRENRD